MPLWGANTSDESKPKNLTAEEKSRVFADTRGWVITRPDGKDEVLVAIRNLSGGDSADIKLGVATISQVFFAENSYTTGVTGSVFVVWNEKVTKSGTPTLQVTRSDTSETVTATYAAGTDTNRLRFDFTAPDVDTSITLSIGAQTIADGFFVDFGTTLTSDATIATADVDSAAVDGGPKTADVVVPEPEPEE
jgi:hypothetical protein